MSGSTEVRTKSELESAITSRAERIIVKGELAEKIHKAEAIKNVSKPALVVFGAALAATPFTGGISGVVGLVGLTATTGLGVVAITAVAFLGLALILTITDGYDRKFTAKANGLAEATMELNRK